MQKNVMITGGADGIGWAVAQGFAKRGHRVALADLDGAKSAARAAELGTGHLGLACDVADGAAVAKTVARVATDLGGLDIVVNNAGVGDTSAPTLDQSTAHFERMLAINLTGTFQVSREAAQVMQAQGRGGAIVNFASIAGLTGLPKRNGYAAAKAGVIALTRNLACEWAELGIRVNAVAPGYVETDLVRKLAADGLLDLSAILRRCPMGRMIRPEEVAEAVIFLASDAASAITGTTLSVDAGWAAFGAAGDAFSAAANS